MDEARKPTSPEPTSPEPTLWETVKGDFASAGGVKLVGIVLLLAWMAFQWGPGNDIILAPLATTVYDTVDDGSSWGIGVTAVAAAGLVSGGFWALTQAVDAVVVLTGLRMLPGLTARTGRSLRRRGLVTPYAEMRWSTRWILAYATGVSVLGLVDVFATGNQGLRGRRKMIMVSVALAAVTVGAVVSVIATATMVARRYPATADEADTFIRYARNPLVWIGIFGTIFAIDRLRSRRNSPDG